MMATNVPASRFTVRHDPAPDEADTGDSACTGGRAADMTVVPRTDWRGPSDALPRRLSRDCLAQIGPAQRWARREEVDRVEHHGNETPFQVVEPAADLRDSRDTDHPREGRKDLSDNPPRRSEQLRGVQGTLTERLGRAIASGRLTGRLDPELLQCRHLVSRSVVRECLRALQAKGLVVTRQRLGTRVAPQTQWSLLDPDVIAWRANGPDRLKQLQQILQLRLALEPQAARLAAAQAEPRDCSGLRFALQRIREAVATRDIPALVEADINFHVALLAASGNPILAHCAPIIPASLRVPELEQATHITDDVLARHAAVAAAIDAGASDEAAAAAFRLAEFGAQLVQTALGAC